MKTVKVVVEKAVSGELRVNGQAHAYDLTPGEHDVHPDVFAALKTTGLAKLAPKATKVKPADKATKAKES